MKCPAYPVSRLSSQHEASRIYSTSAANLTTSSVSKSAHGLQVHDAKDCAIFPTDLGQGHSEVSHCQHTVDSG
jgi:hypothetical protein